jgi:hypothetical protein
MSSDSDMGRTNGLAELGVNTRFARRPLLDGLGRRYGTCGAK